MCRPTRLALPLAVRAGHLVQLRVQGKGQCICHAACTPHERSHSSVRVFCQIAVTCVAPSGSIEATCMTPPVKASNMMWHPSSWNGHAG